MGKRLRVAATVVVASCRSRGKFWARSRERHCCTACADGTSGGRCHLFGWLRHLELEGCAWAVSDVVTVKAVGSNRVKKWKTSRLSMPTISITKSAATTVGCFVSKALPLG